MGGHVLCSLYVCSEHCEQAALLHYLTTSFATFKCSSYLFTNVIFWTNQVIFSNYFSYLIAKCGHSPSCYTLMFVEKYFGYISNWVLPSGLYYLVIQVYTTINCIVWFKWGCVLGDFPPTFWPQIDPISPRLNRNSRRHQTESIFQGCCWLHWGCGNHQTSSAGSWLWGIALMDWKSLFVVVVYQYITASQWYRLLYLKCLPIINLNPHQVTVDTDMEKACNSSGLANEFQKKILGCSIRRLNKKIYNGRKKFNWKRK